MTAFTQTSFDAPAGESRRVHPLIHVGRGLAADFLSTAAFAALYAMTHDVYVATGLAIAIGVGQIAYQTLRGWPIGALQWLTLGLVLVFGIASMVTDDPRFVMLKPTLIYGAVGAVMLKRGWLNRYLPPVVLERSSDVAIRFGYVWAGLMFATAALNLYLAIGGDAATWIWFLGVFPLASKYALIAIQYGTLRSVTRSRLRAAGLLPVRAASGSAGIGQFVQN